MAAMTLTGGRRALWGLEGKLCLERNRHKRVSLNRGKRQDFEVVRIVRNQLDDDLSLVTGSHATSCEFVSHCDIALVHACLDGQGGGVKGGSLHGLVEGKHQRAVVQVQREALQRGRLTIAHQQTDHDPWFRIGGVRQGVTGNVAD